jgi:hypothetical protein
MSISWVQTWFYFSFEKSCTILYIFLLSLFNFTQFCCLLLWTIQRHVLYNLCVLKFCKISNKWNLNLVFLYIHFKDPTNPKSPLPLRSGPHETQTKYLLSPKPMLTSLAYMWAHIVSESIASYPSQDPCFSSAPNRSSTEIDPEL